MIKHLFVSLCLFQFLSYNVDPEQFVQCTVYKGKWVNMGKKTYGSELLLRERSSCCFVRSTST